jgi:hypothetical protein
VQPYGFYRQTNSLLGRFHGRFLRPLSRRDRARKAQIRAIADGKTDPSVLSPGFRASRGWDNGRKKRPWKRPLRDNFGHVVITFRYVNTTPNNILSLHLSLRKVLLEPKVRLP